MAIVDKKPATKDAMMWPGEGGGGGGTAGVQQGWTTTTTAVLDRQPKQTPPTLQLATARHNPGLDEVALDLVVPTAWEAKGVPAHSHDEQQLGPATHLHPQRERVHAWGGPRRERQAWAMRRSPTPPLTTPARRRPLTLPAHKWGPRHGTAPSAPPASRCR
jgi:hypothetical protein